MKAYPLVEFAGSTAVRLDLIEAITWVEGDTCMVHTTTGRQYPVVSTWDQAHVDMYECITLNEKNRR
jgi:hypothetical protein